MAQDKPPLLPTQAWEHAVGVNADYGPQKISLGFKEAAARLLISNDNEPHVLGPQYKGFKESMRTLFSRQHVESVPHAERRPRILGALATLLVGEQMMEKIATLKAERKLRKVERDFENEVLLHTSFDTFDVLLTEGEIEHRLAEGTLRPRLVPKLKRQQAPAYEPRHLHEPTATELAEQAHSESFEEIMHEPTVPMHTIRPGRHRTNEQNDKQESADSQGQLAK